MLKTPKLFLKFLNTALLTINYFSLCILSSVFCVIILKFVKFIFIKFIAYKKVYEQIIGF